MTTRSLASFALVALVGLSAVGRCRAAAGFQARPAGFETSSPVSHLLAGDFDQNGRTDVFFVDSRLGRAVVLFAAPGHRSGFGRFSGTSIGAEAGQAAVADVDGDTLLDYVVPDGAGQIWVGRYYGDIVSRPQSVAGTPVAVAMADWTSGAFTDLVLMDARAGTVSLLANDGGVPPRFIPGQVQPMEAAPVRVLTLDWNGDDTMDILVVQVRQRSDVRDVVLQILTGDGAGRFSAGARLVVDADPATIATADFDADGNVDLVMLDRAGDRCGGNSSILISMGRGDGTFGEIVRREIGCPFFSGGELCPAQTFAVVDWDGQGGDDLVVFLRDPRPSLSSRDFDAAELFLARGANLVAGPVFRTPRGALAAVAGDFTGDGRIDIAVSFADPPQILLLDNTSSPGAAADGNGSPCLGSETCLSGICAEGVCCGGDCGDNESCTLPRLEGTCQQQHVDGVPCGSDSECFDIPAPGDAGFCVDGYCCDERCDGGRCDRSGREGTCVALPAAGSECCLDEECGSGFCRDGVCCRGDCPGGFCDEVGDCRDLEMAGAVCEMDAQCEEGYCRDETCCREGCSDGFCGNAKGICLRRQDPGRPCGFNVECASAICDRSAGVCCLDLCSESEDCGSVSAPGVCVPRFPVCTADCNHDGIVTVDELVVGVAAALGSGTLAGCPGFDDDTNGRITVDELVSAVRQAMGSCPR